MFKLFFIRLTHRNSIFHSPGTNYETARMKAPPEPVCFGEYRLSSDLGKQAGDRLKLTNYERECNKAGHSSAYTYEHEVMAVQDVCADCYGCTG